MDCDQEHALKLNTQLTVLDLAEGPEEMGQAGWDLHPLKGGMKGFWAVSVSGNWRLTFGFEGKDAVLVAYQDYH